MKYTLENITAGQDEVIIRYREMNDEIGQLLRMLESPRKRLIGLRDAQQVVISPEEILYIESVDGRTFVCTQKDVLRVEHTLAQLELLLGGVNFFRCSKSMILNIDQVASLRSLASNRIDAAMRNGEHIIISRTYASDFRKRLKGGGRDE